MAKGIKDTQLGSELGLKGQQPPTMSGAVGGSTLHYQTSITGTPKLSKEWIAKGLRPSDLDLEGKLPKSSDVPGQQFYLSRDGYPEGMGGKR